MLVVYLMLLGSSRSYPWLILKEMDVKLMMISSLMPINSFYIIVEHSWNCWYFVWLLIDVTDAGDAMPVLDILLQAGAAINAADHKGRTPLHLSVIHNSGGANSSTEMEQFLLEKGANVFSRDKFQRLPLHYVFIKGNKWVRYLLSQPHLIALHGITFDARHGDLYSLVQNNFSWEFLWYVVGNAWRGQ